MKAHRSTIATLGTTVAEKRARYRLKTHRSGATPSSGPLIDLDTRTLPFTAVITLAGGLA